MDLGTIDPRTIGVWLVRESVGLSYKSSVSLSDASLSLDSE
jgi:hypothetical protein